MKLHPLRKEKGMGYTTFGCMWKRGECAKETEYICINHLGEEVPMQSRITAYWPDGTVKWTAHTTDITQLGDEIEVLVGVPSRFQGMHLEENENCIVIHSGELVFSVEKNGRDLLTTVTKSGKLILHDITAHLLLEEPVIYEGYSAKVQRDYVGKIEHITVEETGDLRTILRYEGIHENKGGDRKIPFIIRMEIGYNSSELKFTHTFIYDGDENRDFLKGLGIQFHAPIGGEMYNRHVKFMGDCGVFHEAVVPMSSWHPRIPIELYKKQIAGEYLSLSEEEYQNVTKMLQEAPFWSEFSLYQDSVNHFGIKKKLNDENLCYIDSLHGNRTLGGGAFGSENGSVAVAIRDFWEKYPSGLTFKNLETACAEGMIWFWSPEVPAFDFRHYANRGYNQVCYEGYDYKGADPVGIACTNECSIIFSEEMILTDESLETFTKQINNPIIYVGTPEFYHEMKAFGYWSLPNINGSETEKWLEEQLDKIFVFYKEEVEQRNWYGMFNYGDVMHSYDAVRHQWKYDMGGFAWDNTELVPTLWLWLYFMRTGREDVYHVAEKLSRHASEVDVYHMGKYKGLGSRHNVRHWGCPCKEARIAMAGHHRYMYYLTGDRRLEDIFDELKDNEWSFLNKDPLGDFFDKADMLYPSHARSGPDWSSLCSNWMTQWERFNDTKYRDKIYVGINAIKKAPLKLVSGPHFEFDPATCHLLYIGENTKDGCQLQICMGSPQIWTELCELLNDEEWNWMVANLGQVYFMTREERFIATNGLTGKRGFSFPYMASGLGAYGAAYFRDDVLAERVWKELLHSILSQDSGNGFEISVVDKQGNREKLQEISWVSTNYVSQFCLNVIMVLEFIRDKLPATMEEVKNLLGRD